MTLRIVRKKIIQSIADEANRIVEEYAHMDTLPFEGWMWEMMRRGHEYPRLLDECLRDRKSIHANPKYKSIEKPWMRRALFMRLWGRKFASIGLDVIFDEDRHSRDHCHVVRFRDRYETTYMALPDFKEKYTEFKFKPTIIGTRSVKYAEYSAIDEWRKTVEDEEDYSIDEGSIDALLHMLSPVRFENTLYIGISRTGKRKEIEDQVLYLIKRFVKSSKNRVRTDKWKYYLIVYDLAKKDEYGYTKVSEILTEAYPDPKPSKKDKFDPTNIGHYHHAAQRLIDLGGYKK